MAASSPDWASSCSGSASASASAIVAGAENGYHVLRIVGYSRTKVVRSGKCIVSRPFHLGGRTWRVAYYPNGGGTGDNGDYVSFYLHLDDTVSEDVIARATISLLDIDGNRVPSFSYTTNTVNFTEWGNSPETNWGDARFIKREILENPQYLKDDSFKVRIDVAVIQDFRTEETPLIVVPPSDMHRHFGDLLLSREGTDVKFRVGNREFEAHRLVLAARSPVFKAALYGQMRESTTGSAIQIDDMDEKVFMAMLTFIYTDKLPEMEEQQEEAAMAQHLLVAADRYNLERLKLICEDQLSKRIDSGSVANILALAEQHCCHGLKDACLEFLRSPASLKKVMETSGFEYLASSFPTVMKELICKLCPC